MPTPFHENEGTQVSRPCLQNSNVLRICFSGSWVGLNTVAKWCSPLEGLLNEMLWKSLFPFPPGVVCARVMSSLEGKACSWAKLRAGQVCFEVLHRIQKAQRPPCPLPNLGHLPQESERKLNLRNAFGKLGIWSRDLLASPFVLAFHNIILI